MEYHFLQLLFVTLLVVHGVKGQAILVLNAPISILIQNTNTYAAYFADGQNTLEVLFGLPMCYVKGRGSGEYLELYNVNTTLPVGHTGSLDNKRSASLKWNDTAYPMLDPSFTGLYRCRTNGNTSKATYQLNVRTNLSVSCPANVSIDVNETIQVLVNVTHSLPATFHASSMLGNITTLLRGSTGTEYSMTITGNESMLGKVVSVTWYATYDCTECSSVEGKSSVKTACEAISTSASCTTNVYTFHVDKCKIPGTCPTTSTCVNLPGTFNCTCPSGYVYNRVTNECDDVDECQITGTCLTTSTCVNLPGTFSCACSSGYVHNGVINECDVPVSSANDGPMTSSAAVSTNMSAAPSTSGGEIQAGGIVGISISVLFLPAAGVAVVIYVIGRKKKKTAHPKRVTETVIVTLPNVTDNETYGVAPRNEYVEVTVMPITASDTEHGHFSEE